MIIGNDEGRRGSEGWEEVFKIREDEKSGKVEEKEDKKSLNEE